MTGESMFSKYNDTIRNVSNIAYATATITDTASRSTSSTASTKITVVVLTINYHSYVRDRSLTMWAINVKTKHLFQKNMYIPNVHSLHCLLLT